MVHSHSAVMLSSQESKKSYLGPYKKEPGLAVEKTVRATSCQRQVWMKERKVYHIGQQGGL